MSSSDGLAYMQLWIDDMTRLLVLTNEDPLISGVRLRLWTIAATGTLGPVGVLPDDDQKLSHWGNVSPEQWGAMKEAIVGGWIEDEGNWVIRRLVEAAEKRERLSAQASEKAKASWRSRKRGSSTRGSRSDSAQTKPRQCSSNAVADAPAMPQQCSPSPSPSPKKEQKESPPLTPPTPWLSAAEEKELFSLVKEIHRKHPSQRSKLDALLRRWMLARKPWEVVRLALQRTLDHQPDSIEAYMNTIMRREEPNFHERQAIARHERIKAEETGARAGPQVNGGMVPIGDVMTNMALGSAQPEEIQ